MLVKIRKQVLLSIVLLNLLLLSLALCKLVYGIFMNITTTKTSK